MERRFGHCVANWRIKNSFILPMKKTWQISSPVFEVRGFRSTIWIMKLLNKETDGKFNLYFVLQYICSEKEDAPFFGKCDLEISKEVGNCFVCRDEFYFNEFSSNDRILKVIRKSENDPILSCNLCIKCKLFIYFIGVEEKIKTCDDIEIRELSRDLLTAFENKFATDVLLEVRDTNEIFHIEAHKPILISRNKILKKVLDSRKDSMIFCVDYFGYYEEWNNIIRFLYTADIKHVLEPPCEVYHEISETFDIEPITSFYEPDVFNLCSKIPLEEFAITCTISNFLSCEKICFQSSQLQNDTLDTYFKIQLYPKSFYNENNACICVEVGGTVHKIVLVKIFAMNAHILNSLKLIHGEIGNGKTYKGYLFEKRENLQHYQQDGNLILQFKIHMMNLNSLGECEQYSSTSIVKRKPYSDKKNYSTFSADILDLYYNRTVSEKLNFLIAGEECFIHRCILSARAPFLYENVLQSKIVEYEDVRKCVIKDLIYFLYSGKYRSFPRLENTVALTNIAETFQIEVLNRFLNRIRNCR